MRKIGLLISLFAVLCVATSNAAYVDEYPESYTWAYKNGITTQPTIEKANMYGEITRIELSKMISNYAINVLNKKVDTSKKCQFSDISDKLNIQYDLGVTKSCQLGLMGQGITKFRPYDKVTRSEFGTILSRLLYGDKYDGGKPYYLKHINNLNIRGIMNNTNNAEKLDESRGNVMVMLKRSEEKGNNNIPSFEELDDDAFQCLVCDIPDCGYDEILGKSVCNPGDCSYEGIPKKGFIISYKDGYIGYDWRPEDMNGLGLVITYRNLSNPCEILYKTDNVLYYKYDDIGCVLYDGYSDKKIDSFNSKEKDIYKCNKDAEKYFYDLIIGKEQRKYFSEVMNSFKKSIN